MTPNKEKLISDMRQSRWIDERELHTTTWLLKRLREMKSALLECEAYFEPLATGEVLYDGPHGNREMQLLVEVQKALNQCRQGVSALESREPDPLLLAADRVCSLARRRSTSDEFTEALVDLEKLITAKRMKSA